MTTVTKLPVAGSFDFVAHPLANTFPMIEGNQFEELKADIKTHGILEPIRLFQGMILDGRNRYKAAKECGHSFSPADFRQWEGTIAEAEAWVISTNFHRRQLTNTQKQQVIQDMIKKYPSLGDREIARQLGVAHSTVGSARDRLSNSPEVKKFAAFKRAWDGLNDDQCRAFVKEYASDLRLFLNEVAVSSSS
jgi:hypothetical protein